MALRHNTLVFIAVMALQTSLGLLVAYALFKVIRGRRIYRTIVFLPVIFSLVIVGYM
jgi:ABC-type sugar transport system permease subunit